MPEDKSKDIKDPEVVGQVGQTAIDAAAKDKKPKAEKSNKDKKEEDSTSEPTVAGYGVKDLVEAPVKPPEPVVTDSKKETSNPLVKIVVLIGVIVVAIGLVFALAISVAIGLLFMFVGAIAIIACVFLPIGLEHGHKSAAIKR